MGWLHLGAVQHALGRLEQAVISFGNAIALSEGSGEARCARATVLAALGRLDEAEADLRATLDAAPDHVQALHNLGVLLARRGDRQSALQQFDRVLVLDPRHTGARENRASLRLATRNAAGALEDYRALCADSDAGLDSRAGLVRALLLVHRDAEAFEQAQRVAEQHPGERLATDLKAIALASLGRLADAERCFGGTDGHQKARSAFIDRALERQAICDWHDRDRLVDAIRDTLQRPGREDLANQGIAFHALGLPLQDHELKAIAARVAEPIRAAAAGLACRQPLDEAPDGPVRIGFVSPDFREHPGAHLLWPLFANRDRERFQYFAYALSPDDRSTIRKALQGAADSFVDVSALSSAQIVERIRKDRLHLLIDKTGYLEGARPEILAARGAPVQASLKGFQCTLGPGIVDYRISDAMTTPPEAQANWWETLALVPQSYWAYDTSQAIGHPGSRHSHGLPDGGFTYCCFNQAFKISPDIFAVWMRLLRATPGSVLWLLDGGPLVRANLAREASSAGVNPERLVFAPRVPLEAHLGRQRHADLMLDTLYCGAHTTAADALHAGVPIVTCRGRTMASRLCATLVHHAGIPDCVVDSLEEYEERALQIAMNPQLSVELKDRLQAARDTAPFFATRERAQALERAFVAMIERHRTGLPPDTLFVD